MGRFDCDFHQSFEKSISFHFVVLLNYMYILILVWKTNVSKLIWIFYILKLVCIYSLDLSVGVRPPEEKLSECGAISSFPADPPR